MKEKEEIIKSVEEFVRSTMDGHDSGHQWAHIERVVRLSLHICDCEKKGDRFTIELAALLHDVGDHKFNTHDGPAEIDRLLGILGVSGEIIREVIFINRNISFSKGSVGEVKSDELKIVQDADRLDAMGAIGIARAFNYGGFKGREIYDPEAGYLNPVNFIPIKSSSSTVHHFYEKLLILKDLMNTSTGRKLAQERHDFMVRYLEQFFREWDS